MKFSYTWLKDYVRISKTPKELADILTMRAFEVEHVEKAGSDTIFDIAIPPNRIPDAGGHVGMAREIAALLNVKLKTHSIKLKESKEEKTKSVISISIQDDGCRRYVSRVMRGITIKDSPAFVRERLIACGLRPINNVVDATNYVMLETGQPLHVFDLDKVEGGKIVVRSAKQGERMKTLDKQEVTLMPDDLVIADAKAPLALAGIKGGDKAEVDLKTVNIALEAANFYGPRIRKTSKRTGIRTDSSHRFEHNLHPDLALYAMERLAALIHEIAGGIVLNGALDAYPKKEKTREIPLGVERVCSYAGINISAKAIEGVLKRLGAGIKTKKGIFLVKPPAFRQDLEIEEDLIEDVIRVYGYEHIGESFPRAFIPAERNDEVEWMRFMRHTLQGAGFSEVYRYAFIGERELKLLGQKTDEYIEVQNPVSPDCKYLAREPYENLFPFVKSNSEREDTIQAFSMDKGFFKQSETGGKGDEEFGEEKYLTILSCNAERRVGEKASEDFLMMKGVAAHLLDTMGINDYWFDASAEQGTLYPKLRVFNHLHPFRRAEIKIGDDTIGVIGEVHPGILDAWKIDRRMYICEFQLAFLLRYATAEIEFRDIPKFPAIERDVAVLVPEYTRIEEVQGVIENTGGAMLEDSDFFDEYIGSELPDGKRSLAFRLVFRDAKRTLEEREVADVMKKILEVLVQRGWEIR